MTVSPSQLTIAADQLDPEEKPILVTITGDEVAKLYADGYNHNMYMQFVLQRLKNAGAPINGLIHLKCARGKIGRTKTHPKGPGYFGYMWVPPTYVDAIERQLGGFHGTL